MGVPFAPVLGESIMPLENGLPGYIQKGMARIGGFRGLHPAEGQSK